LPKIRSTQEQGQWGRGRGNGGQDPARRRTYLACRARSPPLHLVAEYNPAAAPSICCSAAPNRPQIVFPYRCRLMGSEEREYPTWVLKRATLQLGPDGLPVGLHTSCEQCRAGPIPGIASRMGPGLKAV
jgi:hypothetical protein